MKLIKTSYSKSIEGRLNANDFVLRKSAAENNAYGELLISAPSKDKTMEKKYTIELDPDWKNVYAIAILWEYNKQLSPKFRFVNAVK